MRKQIKINGFTLAELLIALAILGVIATFTIPKILDSGSNAQFNAVAQESISSMAAIHQQLKLEGSLSANTDIDDFTPYLNYVAVNSVQLIDAAYGGTTVSCSTVTCLIMHNGSILAYQARTFNETQATNAIGFWVDPDGKVAEGTATGSGKTLVMWMYYNGRITDQGNIEPNTCNSNSCYNPTPASIPPWFSWSN